MFNLMTHLFFVTMMLVSWSANAAVNIQHWQTSAGSEVYFVENHDLPIVDMSTSFYAGSARDSKEKAGVASLTRYMLSLGADALTETQIAQQMADIGAQLGGEFDVDRASLKLRTLSQSNELGKALDIYRRILQKPDFPADVLAREKTRIIAGLQEAETQPESIASRAFMRALYVEHPYAYTSDQQPASVNRISREDLVQFYQNHYGAQGAVLAIIGDLTRAQAEAIAEQISQGLPKVTQPAPLPVVSPLMKASETRIAHPASQSHILIGAPGVKRGDPDFFPLYVGNYILGGGGFVSRLTEEVREKRGLVYSVYSYFMPMGQLGPFQLGLQTKKEQTNEALAVVRETLKTFIDKGVTAKELQAAKQNLIGGFPLRLDSNSKILDYLSIIGFYKLPLTYLADFNQRVASVTESQIHDAFKRRVNPDQLATVIVGGGE